MTKVKTSNKTTEEWMQDGGFSRVFLELASIEIPRDCASAYTARVCTLLCARHTAPFAIWHSRIPFYIKQKP